MKELVWIDYEDGSDICIGYRYEHDEFDKIVPGPEMTIENIADFCDLNAESRNNHSYVGVHRLLSAILHAQYGRENATKTIRTIAEYGGLDEMNELGGSSQSFKDFGIESPWNDWKLT
jgi:hypothetical protein